MLKFPETTRATIKASGVVVLDKDNHHHHQSSLKRINYYQLELSTTSQSSSVFQFPGLATSDLDALVFRLH